MASYGNQGYHFMQQQGARQAQGNYALYPDHGVTQGGGPPRPAYGDFAEFAVPTRTVDQKGRDRVMKPQHNTRPTTVVSVRSNDRDNATTTEPNDYWITLPHTFKGVRSVELLHAQVPYTDYNVKENVNDVLALEFSDDAGVNWSTATYSIKVPEGAYTLGDLCKVIQDLLNGKQQGAGVNTGVSGWEDHKEQYSRILENTAYPSSTHSVSTDYSSYLGELEAATTATPAPGTYSANFRVGFTWPIGDAEYEVDSGKKVWIANIAAATATGKGSFDNANIAQYQFRVNVASSTILDLLGFNTDAMTAGSLTNIATSYTWNDVEDSYDYNEFTSQNTTDVSRQGWVLRATQLPDTSGVHFLNLCIDGLPLYKFASTSGTSNFDVFAKVPLTADFGNHTFYQPEQLTNNKVFPELLGTLRRLHVRWTDPTGSLISFHGVEHDFSIEIDADRVE